MINIELFWCFSHLHQSKFGICSKFIWKHRMDSLIFHSDENCIRFWCAICIIKTFPNVLQLDQMRFRINISSKWIEVFHWLNGVVFLYFQNHVFFCFIRKTSIDFWFLISIWILKISFERLIVKTFFGTRSNIFCSTSSESLGSHYHLTKWALRRQKATS